MQALFLLTWEMKYRVAMMAVLQNHTYQFNKEARLQSDGGPIGLELAGAMARVVMLWWDRQFLKLAELNQLFLCYNMVAK